MTLKDGAQYQVSYNAGETWRPIERAALVDDLSVVWATPEVVIKDVLHAGHELMLPCGTLYRLSRQAQFSPDDAPLPGPEMGRDSFSGRAA